MLLTIIADVVLFCNNLRQCAAAAATFTRETFEKFAESDGVGGVWLVPESLWGGGALGAQRLLHVQVGVPVYVLKSH